MDPRKWDYRFGASYSAHRRASHVKENYGDRLLNSLVAFTRFVKSLAQFVRACGRILGTSSCAHAHTSRPREFRPFVRAGTRSDFITVTTPELFQNSRCAHWKRPIFTGHAYHLSSGFCAFVRADGGETRWTRWLLCAVDRSAEMASA